MSHVTYFSRKSLIRYGQYPEMPRTLRIFTLQHAEIPTDDALGGVASGAYQLCYADLLIKTI